jgi:hypothetical protein
MQSIYFFTQNNSVVFIQPNKKRTKTGNILQIFSIILRNIYIQKFIYNFALIISNKSL